MTTYYELSKPDFILLDAVFATVLANKTITPQQHHDIAVLRGRFKDAFDAVLSFD